MCTHLLVLSIHSGATAIHVAVRTGAESVVSMLAGMLLDLQDIFRQVWPTTHDTLDVSAAGWVSCARPLYPLSVSLHRQSTGA